MMMADVEGRIKEGWKDGGRGEGYSRVSAGARKERKVRVVK